MKDFNVRVQFATTGTAPAAAGARQVASAMGEVETTARSMMASLAGMAATLGASFSFVAAARQGIEFNRVMEDSRSGLAALIMASTEFTDANGKAVSSQQALTESFGMAEGLQKRLLISAKTTAASYTDLVQAFQTAYGPATAAGITSLDKLEKVVVSGSQAVAALGLDSRQTSQELRALFTGEQGPDNTLNRSLGITKAQLDQVRASGGDVADFLLTKLKPFADAAGASMSNFSVILSNTKDALEQMLGEATKPLFLGLKDAIGGASATFEELKDRIRSISQVAADLVRDFAPVGAALVDAFVAGLKAGMDFLNALRPLAPILKDIVDGVRTVTEAFGGLGVAIGLATVAMLRFSGTSAFGAISAGIAALQPMFAATTAELVALKGATYAAAGAAVAFSAAFVLTAVTAEIAYAVKLMAELRAETEKATQARATSADTLANAFRRLSMSLGTPSEEGRRAAWWAEAVKAGKVSLDEASRALHGFQERLESMGSTAEGVKAKAKDVVDPEELKRAAAEASKLAAAIKQTSDAYAKSLDQMRRQAEGALPDIAAKVGLIDPEVRQIQKAFDEASQTVAEYAFASGKRMDELGAALRRWRDDALAALTDPFKKALPIAKSYLEVVLTIPGQGTKPRSAAGTLDALVDDAIEAGKQIETSFKTAAERAMDAGNGLLAGWLMVLNDIPTAAQSAARGVQEAWAALTRALDNSFFAVLTGKWESFGDIVKGFADDMFRSVASQFTDIVQRILAGIDTIKGEWKKFVDQLKGRSEGQVLGDVAGGAIMGYSASSGGEAIETVFTSILAGIGGGIGGPFGAALGAMIGKLIFSALNRGHEDSLFFGQGDEFDPQAAMKRDFREPWAKVQDLWIANISELFKIGAPEQAMELRRVLATGIREYVENAYLRAYGGDQEELKKAVDKLFSEFLPRQFLQVAFGQIGYDGTTPGIEDLNAWKAAGTTSQVFDENAPLPKLLRDLGVSYEHIYDIASRIITTTGPIEPLLAEIQDLIVILVGFRDLGEELRKTAEDFWKELDDAAKKPAAVGFKAWADDLVQLGKDLSEYTGEERRAKAKELIQLGNEYLEAQRQALVALKQLADEIAGNIQGFLSRMARALMSPEEASWRDELTVYGAPDKIMAATTAADVKRLTDEALAAAERLFEEMLANLKAARAAQADLNALLAEMEGRTFRVSFNAQNMGESWEAVYDLQRRAADAATLSGRAQIDAIAGVTRDARTLWEANQAILQRITENVKNLAKSIEQQKWEIDMGGLDPQAQAEAIAKRIADLRARLAGATSPEEIAALTSELQGLVGRYMGLFSNETNPEVAAAAREWAKAQLTAIEDAARAAYEAMNAEIKAANAALIDILKQLGPALSETITGIKADIEGLRGIIGWIGTVAHEQLKGFAEDIVEAGAEFIVTIGEVTKLFQELEAVLGGGPGGGGPGGGGDDGDDGGDGDPGGGGGPTPIGTTFREAADGAVALGDAASNAAASQLRLRDNADALSAALERLLAVVNTGVPGSPPGGRTPSSAPPGGLFETLRQAGPRMLFARGTGR